jgi:hypothetical protein
MRVNFLHIGEKLGEIELLSLSSFHKLGYECVLHTDITDVPKFVTVRSPKSIIGQFHVTPENVHSISDYFRYKLLSEKGGVWSDTDNVLLRPFPNADYIFPGFKCSVNNHFLKVPANSQFMKNILSEIKLEDVEKALFGGYNFTFLKNHIYKCKLQDYIAPPTDYSYLRGNVGNKLRKKIIDWDKNKAYMVHLMKSTHNRATINSENYRKNIENLKKCIVK